jgi:hypothetical protein
MRIRFSKHRHNKVSFTCVRDDGTATGMPTSPFFVEHDLTHYAVETTLGFDHAFYGSVAHGWDIEAFGRPSAETGRKPRIPSQAAQAEQIVGLVQLVRRGAINVADLEQALALMPASNEQPQLLLTSGQINTILAMVRRLIASWNELPEGEILELRFPA